MATRRSAENTAAASVDATTAPMSSAVVRVDVEQRRRRTSATTPVGDEHADGRQRQRGRRRSGAPRGSRMLRPALVEDDHERGDGEALGELRRPTG